MVHHTANDRLKRHTKPNSSRSLSLSLSLSLMICTCVLVCSFMHKLNSAAEWKGFLEHMEPYLEHLSGQVVIDYILAKSGKSTVVIGIDDSMYGEPERLSSFFNHLKQLASCNSPTFSVFILVCGRSASIIRNGWDLPTRSRVKLRELPLNLLQLDVACNDPELSDLHSNPNFAPVLALTGGHPRSISYLAYRCRMDSTLEYCVRYWAQIVVIE